MSYVLILGAKSDIAAATAREYAKNGYDLYLASRDSSKLGELANDITVRTSSTVKIVELDILDYVSHQAFYDMLDEKPLGVISAVGYLGEQQTAEQKFSETKLIIDSNFTGIVSLLNIIANDFEKRKSGFIIGISSVAGERGRKSNYIYGAAKAAFTAYLSGLRNRLYESSVHVMTVNPGFVATKMTAGMDLPDKLTAEPESVARSIFKAQKRNCNVLYTKWIWRYIMLAVRLIPEWKFKGMNI